MQVKPITRPGSLRGLRVRQVRLLWLGAGMTVCFGLATTGCADLPPLEADECGNGILEPRAGEDCDGLPEAALAPSSLDEALGKRLECGAPDSPQACRYVWDGERLACPNGWGAGVDGICRRASGSYEAPSGSPWSMTNMAIGVGRVDDDVWPDLIGRASGQVITRYGSGGLGFGAELATETGGTSGLPAFIDFTGDGLLDVVEPQIEGLVAMVGQHERALEPVVYPTANSESPLTVVPADVVGIDEVTGTEQPGDGSWLVVVNAAGLTLVSTLMGWPGPTTELPPACQAIATDPDANAIRIPRTTLSHYAAEHGVEDGFALACPGANRVYVYRTEWQLPSEPYPTLEQVLAGLTVRLVDEVALPHGYTVANPPQKVAKVTALFGDEGGDGLNDLFVRAVAADGQEGALFAPKLLYPSFGFAPFEASASPILTYVGEDDEVVSVAWPLALGHLTADNFIDFVAGEGVGIRTVPGDPAQLATGPFFPWDDAAIGDFNSDGNQDLVAVSSTEQGVEWMLGSGAGQFNLARVATEGYVAALRIGDFSGDYVQDVALIEVTPDATHERSVSVVHGSKTGAPARAQRMGRIGQASTFEPIRFVTLTANDATDDLVLVTHPPDAVGPSTFWVSYVYGGAGRMLPPLPLSLRSSDIAASVPVPIAATSGRFAGGDQRGLFALAFEIFPLGGDVTVSATWLPTTPQGQVRIGSGVWAPDVMQGVTLTEAMQAGMGPWCAATATGVIDASGRDVLVHIDRNFACCAQYGCGDRPALTIFGVSPDGGSVAFSEPVALDGELRLPVKALLNDVDADGQGDLVVVFMGDIHLGEASIDERDDGLARFRAAGLAVYWNEDGSFDLEHPAIVDAWPIQGIEPPPTSVYPIAVTAIDADSDGQEDLAVVTSAGVYFVTEAERVLAVRGMGPAFGSLVPYSTGAFAEDLDLDGLADLIIGTPNEVRAYHNEPKEPQNEFAWGP